MTSTASNGEIDEVTAGGADVEEITAGGNVVWTSETLVEDFEHNDLNGRYDVNAPNMKISSGNAYWDTYKLDIPESSSGGRVPVSSLSPYNEVCESGRTYRVPFQWPTNDGGSPRADFYIVPPGVANPQHDQGYAFEWRADNNTFLVEEWFNGTLFDSSSTSFPSLSYGNYHYLEVSYLNGNDAGSNTVRGRLINSSGSTLRSLSVGDQRPTPAGWAWREHWGYDTTFIGGIEVLD